MNFVLGFLIPVIVFLSIGFYVVYLGQFGKKRTAQRKELAPEANRFLLAALAEKNGTIDEDSWFWLMRELAGKDRELALFLEDEHYLLSVIEIPDPEDPKRGPFRQYEVVDSYPYPVARPRRFVTAESLQSYMRFVSEQ
ncbi:MAG: hypothetical protein K2W82_11265 [Candidatus Obscuribacterales bacterium]|nr:hypothetical protein [Candidatus Obscuribacterales bacterium]